MKKYFKITIAHILFVTLICVNAFSEEGITEDKSLLAARSIPKTMDEVVVTARGVGAPVSQTPGGVGVLDSETVSEQQPVSLSNAARRIPGVEKSSDSAWGSAINIRGLGRNSVVFLIDGCRVNTSTDINGRFGLVNPSDIERVEVLKGPVSALYGSGSTGGVVNVITKKGRFTDTPEWHGETSLTYGDNPQGLDTYGNLSFNSPDYWVFASGSYRDHDNYDAGDGEEIDNSQFRDHHAKAAAGFKWNPHHVTELTGLYSEAENVGIPGKGLALPSGPDVTFPRTSLALVSLTHTFTPEAPVFKESRLNFFYQKIQRRVRIDNFPETFPLAENRPGADHETWGMKWQNRFDLGDHTLMLGADVWDWEIGTSERYKTLKNGRCGVDSSLGDVEQLSAGIFAEDAWQLGGQFVLNIGGRVDYIEAESCDLYNWITPPAPSIPVVLKREGETYDDVSWNAHAGLTWNFASQWSATFISASSYRAPDLMDRFKYISLGGGVELFGNPDLDPERSLFFESGLHYTTPNLRFTAAAYANYLDDLITEKVISDTLRRMENVDEAEIYGAELDAEWYFLPEWAVYANVAFTDGEDTTTGEDLPFIPPVNGVVGVRCDHSSGFWGSAEMEWALKQDDVPSGGMESDSWETVNLRAGYRFPSGRFTHEIMLGVDNLFDREYRNYLSTSRDIELKEPGIGFLGMWRVQF